MKIDPFSTLAELSAGLARHEFTSEQLAGLYLQRIAQADGKLHAFASVDAEGALRAARAADARRAQGCARGPLDGLPIAVKDLFDIEGGITACGSAAWQARRSGATAQAVQRILDAGMVVLGKTHMVEFAFGLWGNNPLLGTPWNPWDPGCHRVPGGSSSGSAVAVAAGLAPAALGSDTGGSVRVPAALNGLTGLKPTAGAISLAGALPLSPTLDSCGPICRDAADAGWLMHALTGAGDGAPTDPTRVIAMHEEDFPVPVHAEVLRVFRETRETLAGLGVQVEERRLPFDFGELATQCARLIAGEAWRVHAAYAEDETLAIGPWVRQRILSGKSIDDAELQRYVDLHREQSRRFSEWMAGHAALLTPATALPAAPLADVDEQVSPYAAFARAANFLGACAMAFPAGFSPGGLPLGMQLMAKAGDEAALLQITGLFQRETSWHRRVPGVAVRP